MTSSTDTKQRPCPAYIIDRESGERVYCEQGEDGHPGTCCGSRPEWEYRMMVREVAR